MPWSWQEGNWQIYTWPLYVQLTCIYFWSLKFQSDSLYMLSAPQRHEILPSPIWNKLFTCLVMCFNVKKNIVQSVIKLDQPITQYGRVTRLEGGNLMIGWELVPQTDDGHDASFVWVESCFSICTLPEHYFIQYTHMLAKREHLNLNFKISLANYNVFLF